MVKNAHIFMKFSQNMYFDTIFLGFSKKKFYPVLGYFRDFPFFPFWEISFWEFLFDPLYLAFVNWILVKEGIESFNLSGHRYL